MHLTFDTAIRPDEVEKHLANSINGIIYASDYSCYWYMAKSLDDAVAADEARVYVTLTYDADADLLVILGECNVVYDTDSRVTQKLMNDQQRVQDYVLSRNKKEGLLRPTAFTEILDITPIERIVEMDISKLMEKQRWGYPAVTYRVK